MAKNLSSFVFSISFDFWQEQIDTYQFFQGFQTLRSASIGNMSQEKIIGFVKAQRENQHLKQVDLYFDIKNEMDVRQFFQQLQQIEYLECPLDVIEKIIIDNDLNPHHMLKSIRITDSLLHINQPKTVIENFLQSWQKLFPNLRHIVLFDIETSRLEIPEYCHQLINSIYMENSFSVLVEKLNTVSKSMPNCKEICLETPNHERLDLKKLVKLENVTKLEMSFPGSQMKLEEIYHHILLKMPNLNSLFVYISVLTSDLTHEDILELFGNRVENFERFCFRLKKVKNIQCKTIRKLKIQMNQNKSEYILDEMFAD